MITVKARSGGRIWAQRAWWSPRRGHGAAGTREKGDRSLGDALLLLDVGQVALGELGLEQGDGFNGQSPAVYATDQAAPFKERQVATHRFRGHVKIGRQFGDRDSAVPGHQLSDRQLALLGVHLTSLVRLTHCYCSQLLQSQRRGPAGAWRSPDRPGSSRLDRYLDRLAVLDDLEGVKNPVEGDTCRDQILDWHLTARDVRERLLVVRR